MSSDAPHSLMLLAGADKMESLWEKRYCLGHLALYAKGFESLWGGVLVLGQQVLHFEAGPRPQRFYRSCLVDLLESS